MMGWARIDDGFHDHPKVIGLSLEAVGLWTKCLTWARRHSTSPPGYIPDALPKTYAGRRAKIITGELVDAGLWDIFDGSGELTPTLLKLSPSKLQRTPGWVIHDYEDYLSAAERTETASAVSKSRSEAGRRGARARWGVTNGSQPDSNLPSDSMASADGKPMPPTRPDPTHGSEGLSTESHLSNEREHDDHHVEDEPRSRPVTTQARKLARAYTDKVKLSDTGKVCGVVTNAQNAGYTDARITDALGRLADNDRPVTADTLRIEIESNGKPLTKSDGRHFYNTPGEHGKALY